MNKRKLEETFFIILMILSLAFIAFFLIGIIATIFFKGISVMNLDMITKIPDGGYYIGKTGGVLNAILGSLFIGIGAVLISLMIALPVAFYIHLYASRHSLVVRITRFCLDILWGIPSIVYGALGFSIMIFFRLRISLLAGMITVAFLILPIMIRSFDEMLKLIPKEIFYASYSLGANRLETAWRVILKQAIPGLLSAIIISFGRGIGDAASVLFTAGFTDNLPDSLFSPVATLPLAIFFQLGTPYEAVQNRAYASALILTSIILIINVIIRIINKLLGKHIIK